MEKLKKLFDIIFGDSKVVVITGAGISTLSGIRDFRGENGLYTKGINVEYLLSHHCLEHEPDKFYEFYTNNLMPEGIEPNIVHKVLAKLEERGLIDCIITQNVDGLHHAAGSKNVIELHGNGTRFYCTNCNKTCTFEEYKYGYNIKNEIGEEKHVDGFVCKHCGHIVRPDIVLYDEFINADDNARACVTINAADKVIVLGSSLVVPSIFRLLNSFLYSSGKFRFEDLFIVNKNRTRYDYFGYVCRDDLGEVFELVKKKLD